MARLTCTLNLGKEDNEKFEVLFKQIAENKTRKTAQAVVNFIDNEIREKEGVIHNLRVSALKRIRNTSFNFNREQTNFDEIILNTYTKHLEDLQNFRDRLQSFQLQLTNHGNRTVTGHPKENPDMTADKTISAAITR